MRLEGFNPLAFFPLQLSQGTPANNTLTYLNQRRLHAGLVSKCRKLRTARVYSQS